MTRAIYWNNGMAFAVVQPRRLVVTSGLVARRVVAGLVAGIGAVLVGGCGVGAISIPPGGSVAPTHNHVGDQPLPTSPTSGAPSRGGISRAQATADPTAATTLVPLRWSQTDNDWATTTLLEDRYLDTQAETTYPGLAPYYAGWVQRWTACLGQIAAAEHGSPPVGAPREQAVGWFQAAISAHRADIAASPRNAVWDEQWIRNYQRLIRLWGSL